MPFTYLKGEGGDKLKVRDIDGAYTFPWNNLENHDEEFRSIPNWKARDDDVMICVYPKSVDGNSWFDYTNDWEKTIVDNPDYPIHIMYFEDMVENIHAEIFKLANFLEVCTHSTLDFINSVASLCTIDKMRNEKATTAALNWKEGSAGVYRKGIVGDWKSMFSVTQNETFDELYHARMNKSKLNIRFSIPEKLPAKSRSVFH
ncbi:sulfotransferase 1B1-like [Mytilus galloprovincialis]|uniref:sulfotransferase 1B1-like n=1 Tax=Mytilus galloprovincialis TaxID=29158 RepID=UPI003F7C3F59